MTKPYRLELFPAKLSKAVPHDSAWMNWWQISEVEELLDRHWPPVMFRAYSEHGVSCGTRAEIGDRVWENLKGVGYEAQRTRRSRQQSRISRAPAKSKARGLGSCGPAGGRSIMLQRVVDGGDIDCGGRAHAK